MENEALFHFGVAVAASYLLQGLKRWKWAPWFHRHSDRVNRIAAILLALGNTTGVDFMTTGTLAAGGVISFTFPPLTTLLSNITDAFGSFGMQEGFYRMAIKGATTTGTGIEGKLREAVDAALARFEKKG